jgi:GT2 family glycosyltransferase
VNWPALLAAADSVRRQSTPPRELIVVIDHNPALLARAIQGLPGARVVENQAEAGLSGARNTAIALAAGGVIAFLDDDAAAAPNWLDALLAGYADPRVIGVGGAIEPRWAAGRPAWFPPEFDWVVGCTYAGLPLAPAPVRNLIGANMSLRADLFAEVGGFRSSLGRVQKLPAGCEETEWCIRAAQRRPGAELRYDPGARVAHQVPAERATWTYFCSRCYAEGRSKALVARLVGAGAGLASERAYVRRTLPMGVARGLRLALRGEASGLGRAWAISAGLVITALGYLAGWLSSWRAAPAGAAAPAPAAARQSPT